MTSRRFPDNNRCGGYKFSTDRRFGRRCRPRRKTLTEKHEEKRRREMRERIKERVSKMYDEETKRLKRPTEKELNHEAYDRAKQIEDKR